MIQRMWCLFRFELSKALRLKYSYLGPALMLISICCVPIMQPLERDEVADYAFIGYAVPISLNLIGALVLLVYCANLVSSELGSGTIRMVLVRPLRRCEFILAKLLTGMAYALALSALAAGASWALAFALGDLGAVTSGDEVIYTAGQMASAFWLGWLVNLAPQFAAVAFAVMISSLTTSTGAAVGGTVGLWVLLDAVKHPLRIAPYLFTSYMESPWRVFVDRSNMLPEPHWFPSTAYCLITSAVAFLVCTGVAMCSFSRRNLSA